MRGSKYGGCWLQRVQIIARATLQAVFTLQKFTPEYTQNQLENSV